MELKEITTDILIIGAGPAGLSAALYAARAGKKTMVLKGKSRPHLDMAHRVDNYPGIESTTGPVLLAAMEAQAKRFGAEIIEGDALSLGLDSDTKMVSTRSEFITAQAVILAMGKGEHKKHIPGEEDYLGMGLSYCAVCDGAFYKGKQVAVYGSDHEAVVDAQMLAELGCRTTLILHCRGRDCPQSLVDDAAARGVTVMNDTEITGVHGNGRVEGISWRGSAGEGTLALDGLFVIQAVPAVSILKSAGVQLADKDCIHVNRAMETSIPGVFAAGDITCGGLQIVIAAGEGAVAALSALRYLQTEVVRDWH